MISIKDVYSTVLYAMNKEQRGYIGPDEFNRFADMSQVEIFEGYFTDLAHYAVNPKGMIHNTGYSDLTRNTRMKIDVFAEVADLTYNSSTSEFDLPDNLYRLDTVAYKPNATTFTTVPEMSKMDSYRIQQAPLMQPSSTFPRFERFGSSIKVYPAEVTDNISVQYIKNPATPEWAYNQQVANATDGVKYFDAGLSTDFELHESEKYVLVRKILEYAGLSTKEADVVQFAQAADAEDAQIKRA